MKLKSIYYKTETAYKVLSEIESTVSYNDVSITNWSILRDQLKILFHIPYLSASVEQILEVSTKLNTYDTEVVISSTQYAQFKKCLEHLMIKMQMINELCASLGFEFFESGFDVKVPETTNFDDFANNIKEFNKFLKLCPFLKDENAEISIAKTDVGSTWLEFAVAGTAALGMIKILAEIVKSVVETNGLIAEQKHQKESFRLANIDADDQQTIEKAFDKVLEQRYDGIVNSLSGDQMKLSPEERAFAIQSLQTLSQLMARGLEVHAAIDSADEIKALFPTQKEQTLLSQPKKQLSENIKQE